jgi:hypothetical protein
MNKIEWMTENPCDRCSWYMQEICKRPDDMGCFEKPQYLKEKLAQKKLLEYLIANPNMTSGKADYVSRWTLGEMLKQLEENNE